MVSPSNHLTTRRPRWLIVVLLLLVETHSFLLPSFGPKNNILPTQKQQQQQRQKKKQPKSMTSKKKRRPPADPELKDSFILTDLLTNANAVLSGMGAGIGAWTALSGPLKKKKRKNNRPPKKQPSLSPNAWSNMAASFALLAAGATAEATAVPLWVLASAAGIIATQQQKDQDDEMTIAANGQDDESFAWSEQQRKQQEIVSTTTTTSTTTNEDLQEQQQADPIWVENELGLVQEQAAHLLDDVTNAVDRLYEQASIASEAYSSGGGGGRYNGSSASYGTGYAAGAAKPLYFSPMGSQQLGPDAVSDFVTNLDAAVSSLQEYTPEPYLDGSKVRASKMSTIPQSGTHPFQQNQFSPTKKNGWDTNGKASPSGYMTNYLDEINNGESVMAVPSYAAPSSNGQTAAVAMTNVNGQQSTPEQTTIESQPQEASIKSSYAPTQSKNVKGIASSAALAQAGSYLEQLQDAVAILPSLTTTTTSVPETTIEPPPVAAAEPMNASSETAAAPKMTTIPARQSYAPGSFAPTKSNIKGVSSHSVSQAGGYLDQLKTAVTELASIAAVQEQQQQQAVDDDASSQTTDQVVAPKMTTVPMGRQTFHRDSFAPTQPSVKNTNGASMAGYLNNLGSAVEGLSSFVGTVQAAVAETVADETAETIPAAPKMTTVPAKVCFAQGSFAPTKSNIKNISATSVAQAGGYLEQLQGAVAVLSSYAVAEAPDTPQASVVVAPKMTTVPMGKQNFKQDSFAPTKPSIKNMNAPTATSFSNYLSHLQGAVSGLSSFVESVSQEVVGEAPVAAAAVEEVRAPKMTTVPAQQTFAQGSFAPTKSSIKDISSTTLSQASNYLDQLKGAAVALASATGVIKVPTEEQEEPAPKMTTIPIGKQVFNRESFAPTPPSIKNLDASAMKSYLSELGSAVSGLSTFVEVVKEVVPPDAPIAPKMTTVPMGGQTFPQKSYAPTKQNVKGLASVSVSQAGGYLESLKDAMEGLSSFTSSLPSPEVPEAAASENSVASSVAAPKMTTVPMGKQAFHRDSFAPTRPSVKDVDSKAIAGYLDNIGKAAMGLSSFVDAVTKSAIEEDPEPPAPKMTTVPMGKQKFSQESFAPTKSGVKGLSSFSVSQAGGYLASLKDAIEGISTFASTVPEVLVPTAAEPDVVAPKMTTVPMGKQSFHRNSFAPTQPSVKNMDSVSIASYVDGLGHAVEGLATFVDDVVQAVSSPDPPAPKMTTVPMGHHTFSQASFAPTKSSVKGISSTSVSQAGFYLDNLKQAAQSLSTFAKSKEFSTSDEKAKKTDSMVNLVHNLRDTASKFNDYTNDFDGLSSHLETLNSAVHGMEQFVDEVKRSITEPAPESADYTAGPISQLGEQQTASVPFSSMPRTATFSKSFAPTQPGVKGMSGGFVAPAGENVPPASPRNKPQLSSSPFSSMPKAVTFSKSFAPTKSSVKSVQSASRAQPVEYTPPATQLTESRTMSVPFSSMPKASAFSKSFAPTKPGVKGISGASVAQAGGYLDQLKDAIVQLSSFSEVMSPPSEVKLTQVTADTEKEVDGFVAPKMTTVPMGKQTFGQTSFAPTKSDVKNISSRSLSAYLDGLNDAVHGISSFVEAVQESTFENATPFSSMPKGTPFVSGTSFAPTKSGVKNISSTTVSQAGGYLEQLRKAVDNLQAVASVPAAKAKPQTPPAGETVAPKMTTVPMGKPTFKQASFAPTKPDVKNHSSQELSVYLSSLKNAVHGLSSFVETVGEALPAVGSEELSTEKLNAVPFSSMPKAGSYKEGSFAPTKPTIKDATSTTVTQSGYLGNLNNSRDVATPSFDEKIAPIETDDAFVAPKMTTVPMGKQAFRQASFAPTKSDVKNLPSSVSLPNYLSGLNNAVAGLSSFIESVDKAVAFSSMPKASTYAPGSFAPTKAGVKTVQSSSVAQAGGYLDKLRNVVSELSSFAAAHEEVKQPLLRNSEEEAVAPKMTTVPMGKKQFKQGSFAPTKSSVKNVKPITIPSYLEDLQDAVSGLSSFMNELADSVAVSADVVPPRMTTMPAKVTMFQKGAFAPTKASVKDMSGSSSGIQGNYLDAISDGLESLRSQIGQVTPVVEEPPEQSVVPLPAVEVAAPKMTTIPAKQVNLRPEGYAPTKPSIKSLSSPATQAGGYLDNLKNAVSGLSSFVDAVSNAPIPAEAPVEQLKASVDRLTPFVTETPSITTALEPVQLPSVSQPVLDSAVATLNQKLSSLSIVVSDLSAANEVRNKNLEAKVDDLSETVRTLNQSVSNLATCIQALNDGFSGLMAVAGKLQTPETMRTP